MPTFPCCEHCGHYPFPASSLRVRACYICERRKGKPAGPAEANPERAGNGCMIYGSGRD